MRFPGKCFGCGKLMALCTCIGYYDPHQKPVLDKHYDKMTAASSRPPLSHDTPLSTVLAELQNRSWVEIETGEGIKLAHACVAEDGSRAIVIELDPIAMTATDSKGRAEFEPLYTLWVRGAAVKAFKVTTEIRVPDEIVAFWERNSYEANEAVAELFRMILEQDITHVNSTLKSNNYAPVAIEKPTAEEIK